MASIGLWVALGFELIGTLKVEARSEVAPTAHAAIVEMEASVYKEFAK